MGIVRRREAPVFSEDDFQALKDMVLFPGDAADAVEVLTRDFAQYIGVSHGVAVNSGTSALEIAVSAAGIGPDDEVIVPSYSYYSTASAVFKARAIPVFADVRLEDGCIDPEAVRRLVTTRTKAVIAVHLAGVPANLDELADVCSTRNLILIEDVAQAVGSEWRGRKLGSFGAMGCFSFQSSKNLAAGEGGFITTNDTRLHAVCAALADVGVCPDGDESEHVLLGGNYRMPHLEAAILSILLEKIDESIARREANAAFLTESLRGIPGVVTPVRPAHASRINYHFYGIRLDKDRFNGRSSAEFISALKRDGLPCERGYDRPLYAQPAFQQDVETLSKTHPHTLRLCEDTMGFGHSFLLGRKEDMVRLVGAIEKLSTRSTGGQSL